jgi:hypothetical protein
MQCDMHVSASQSKAYGGVNALHSRGRSLPASPVAGVTGGLLGLFNVLFQAKPVTASVLGRVEGGVS